ncbi:MAG TPA: hypothetical protein VN207_03600 [Ktedonobacteraceae bacterium]|nr:hypothetical protein [Ktedonobacteraceae bacterium]
MRKANMVYIDENGKAWITGEGVAKVWNERAAKEFSREGRYTRWAARNRVENNSDLSYIDTEDGRLYSKADAEKVNLRPRSKGRPDVKERAATAFKKKGAHEAEPLGKTTED